MTRPRTPLITDMIGGVRQFWSMGDLLFSDHKGAKIVIESGFLSDGLSIPKIFQNIFSKSPHFIYAGILHDFLYRDSSPFELTRFQADKLFLFYMKKYKVPFLSRQTIFAAVRLGGWASWKKHKAKFV